MRAEIFQVSSLPSEKQRKETAELLDGVEGQNTCKNRGGSEGDGVYSKWEILENHSTTRMYLTFSGQQPSYNHVTSQLSITTGKA